MIFGLVGFRNFRFLYIISFLIVAVFLIVGCEESSDTVSGSPDEDTVSNSFNAADFESVDNCDCHPTHVTEWSGSMHAYAMKDPVFYALRDVGQSAYINALDQACVQCHSIIGSRGGEIPWGPIDTTEMSQVSREGIGCDVCHTITAITGLSNAGVDLTPGHVKYGTIREPVPNEAHESEYNSLYESSEYCGSCHDFVSEDGLAIEATFREWQASGFAETGKTCQDCHMPTYTGRATPDGPERTLHRHTFAGANRALIDFPQKEEQVALITHRLQTVFTLEVTDPVSVAAGGQMPLEIRITNDSAGHNVPTGVPFNRQMWIAIVVKDATGDTIYATGQLDSNDDLMDEFSEFPERDNDLTNFQASMLRADSIRTGATWDAVYLINRSIKPRETRVVDYVIDVPLDAVGPLTVDVAVRYRSLGPHLLRSLGLDELLPLPIVNMVEDSKIITVQ